jgi:hypothetical protein
MGIQRTIDKDDLARKTAPVSSPSIIKFYRLIEDTPKPQRADRSAGGLIPTRAFRYCEPMTTASAFGWYIFPPMDFSVLWNGSEIFWQYGDMDNWLPLEAAQYPYFSTEFDQKCPTALQGYAPPFISRASESGVLKIWSGLLAKTQPDWSILVRQPANLPTHSAYEHYEGIIETDRWFGPLFTNLRLRKTDIPITFKREMPLIQIQPLHRQTYAENILKNFEFAEDMTEFETDDWDDYKATVVDPGPAQERARGLYAKASRKARK